MKVATKRKRLDFSSRKSVEVPEVINNVINSNYLGQRRVFELDGVRVEDLVDQPCELTMPELKSMMMVYPIDGVKNNFMRFGGKKFKGNTGPGEFFILPPNTPSYFSWDSINHCLLISIDEDFLSSLARELPEANSDGIEIIPYLNNRDQKIDKFVELFVEQFDNGNLGGKLYLETLATDLALHIIENYSERKLSVNGHKAGISKQSIKTAIQYINDNLEKNISLADLARTVGISKYHFARQFKMSTGMPPHQYIIKVRINRAKELLSKSELSIAQIAYKLGFSSQSHLNFHFHRLIGKTPKNYRKEHLNMKTKIFT